MIFVLGRRLMAVLLLVLASLVPAAAEGLFAPLPSGLADAAAARSTPGMAVVRSRDVALDAAYMAARIAPEGVDDAANRLDLAPPAGVVRIELFKGIILNFQRHSLSEAFGGGFVWTGRSRSGVSGTADLVIRDGRVTGVVNVGSRLFRIDPLGVGRAHRISELNEAAFPGDIEMPVRTPPGTPAPRPQSAPANTETEITVLIAYTTRARDSMVDIVAQANLAVARSNTAFERSNVLIRFRLVGTRLVTGYDEQAADTYNDVLYNLTDGTASGPFLPVHQQRDAAAADLVALLIVRNEYCGLAWRVDNPTPATAPYGMSVTTASCISNETFAHELGHNMGLRHDRHVSPDAPNSAYNYGFVSIPGRFRTIMSYNNLCAEADVTCARINNFSNPSVSHEGRPTGISAGNDGAADAARRLNETRDAIASYRSGGETTTTIVAAVTPVTRATQVGSTVTAFATVINSGNVAATSCSVAAPGGSPLTFTYRSRNHVNGILGTVNQPVGIAAGGRQDFLMAFTPTGAMQAELALVFDCTNTPPAPSVVGLNTFLLIGTTSAPPADMLSIAETSSRDGIMNIPLGGSGFAALAAMNIGASAQIQARLSASSILSNASQLPNTTSMVICRTNPNTGACLANPTAMVNFTPGANEIVTFTAFVTSNGTAIPYNPASTRLFVHFFQGSTPVGSASVAARTVANNDVDTQAALAD